MPLPSLSKLLSEPQKTKCFIRWVRSTPLFVVMPTCDGLLQVTIDVNELQNLQIDKGVMLSTWTGMNNPFMTGIGAHHFTLLGCRLCIRAPSQRPEFEKFVILKGDRWLPLSRMNRLRTVKQKSSNRKIFIFINTKKKCRFRNGSFVKSHLENRLFGQKLAPVVPQIWRIPSSKPRPISMVHWTSLDIIGPYEKPGCIGFCSSSWPKLPGLILVANNKLHHLVSFSLGGRKITFPGESGFFYHPTKTIKTLPKHVPSGVIKHGWNIFSFSMIFPATFDDFRYHRSQ